MVSLSELERYSIEELTKTGDKFYEPLDEEAISYIKRRGLNAGVQTFSISAKTALRLIASIGQLNHWRSIESAPRDGTAVDLWRRGERLIGWSWNERHKSWSLKHGYPAVTTILGDPMPTHWMPQPSAPSGN